MPPAPPRPPSCSLYLVTPLLSAGDGARFAALFGDVLAAAPFASARLRLASDAEGEAKAILAPLVQAAAARGCAVLLEGDPRRAARLGADGVHVEGVGEALDEALASLKPDRIVGAGSLRLRDDAMTAGDKGADYVMFGEPRGAGPAMPLGLLVERVAWWAEIFETPCVAYAESVEAAASLARAGADFVALETAVWEAESPPDAARSVHALVSAAAAEAS
jgi:thiamine-phosphate pyrophosphorylase